MTFIHGTTGACVHSKWNYRRSKKRTVFLLVIGANTYKLLSSLIAPEATGNFQRVMENVLQGIPNVIVYLDDILLSSATESEHLQLIGQVLNHLEKAGLRARKEKCQFLYHLLHI